MLLGMRKVDSFDYGAALVEEYGLRSGSTLVYTDEIPLCNFFISLSFGLYAFPLRFEQFRQDQGRSGGGSPWKNR